MPFTLVPALELQRRLYDQPRDLNRFRAYLDEITDHADGLKLQLSAFNPMAGDHGTEAVRRLIDVDAETVAATALDDANDRLERVPGLPTWRVTVVLSDDLGGMWTHRPTAEFDRATQPGYEDWLAATFWTSDQPSAASVRAEVLRACYRAAHLARAGTPATLGEVLRQEALAARFAGAAPSPLDAVRTAHVASVVDALRDRTDRPTLLAALQGDEAGAALGYAPVGLDTGEALTVVTSELGAIDPVQALLEAER